MPTGTIAVEVKLGAGPLTSLPSSVFDGAADDEAFVGDVARRGARQQVGHRVHLLRLAKVRVGLEDLEVVPILVGGDNDDALEARVAVGEPAQLLQVEVVVDLALLRVDRHVWHCQQGDVRWVEGGSRDMQGLGFCGNRTRCVIEGWGEALVHLCGPRRGLRT